MRMLCLDCGAVTTGSRCPACERLRQRRRLASFGGSGWSWSATRRRILQRDGDCVMDVAVYGPHAGPLEIDHIMPRQFGGTNDDANLRVLCRRHHVMVTTRARRLG